MQYSNRSRDSSPPFSVEPLRNPSNKRRTKRDNVKKRIIISKRASIVTLASSMGNAVGSFFSGFGQVVGKILGHPLDFLSGKSCNSLCGSTWDFICYIENFCVSHLLKLAMVATLFYFVLLFFYLLYNLGICQCICRTLCRIVWACFATYFSALDFCCTYLCYKLRMVKRKQRRRKRDIEKFAAPSTSTSEDDCELGESSTFQQRRNLEHGRSQFSRRRNYKYEHLRRSLRPTTHRAHLKFSGNSIHLHRKKILKNIGDHASPLHHHIRVTRSFKFLQKGTRRRTRIIIGGGNHTFDSTHEIT